MTTYKVQLEPSSPSLSAELTGHLMQDLLASNEQAENTEFTLIARNEVLSDKVYHVSKRHDHINL